MSKKNAPSSAADSKKGSAVKTFLSVIFFVLILISALALAVNMSMANKSPDILDAYKPMIGKITVTFLKGKVAFWCAISSIVLWTGLWIGTTKRVASAIRGLGIACTLAPMSIIVSELVTMLLVCVFKMDSVLTPFTSSLPSQFTSTAGNNFIFMFASAVIASIGIFICKIKKMPKRITASESESKSASKPSEPATEPVPEPVVVASAASVSSNSEPALNAETNIADNVKSDTVSKSTDDNISLVDSLVGVCHNCGAKNSPDVNFCGSCGAKLIH